MSDPADNAAEKTVEADATLAGQTAELERETKAETPTERRPPVSEEAPRPEGAAADAPLLRMELDKAAWQAVPDKQRLTAAIPPEDILLLK